jgi:hypothetical protein
MGAKIYPLIIESEDSEKGAILEAAVQNNFV